MNTENDWCWTTYHKTGWIKDNGKKLYEGLFRTMGNARDGYLACKIPFYASRPVIAMRTIVNSGKHPQEFYSLEVN
jgi:hypothetical protein